MNWQDFRGNGKAVDRIRRMLSTGKIPHALLFAGPAGVGKRLASEMMAAELLQTEPEKLSEHPDFCRIEPEGSRILISQVRELQRRAGLASLQGGYRFCLIDPADCMDAPAANCLLKILEEPPTGLIFCLITEFPHSLLSTIRSRTAEIRFFPAPELQTLTGVTAENRLQALQLAQAVSSKGMEWIWSTTAALEGLENDRILDIIKYWIFLLRDLAVLAHGRSNAVLLNENARAELSQLADGWDPTAIAGAIGLAENCRRHLQRNVNSRLALEALLIRSADLYWGGKENADHRGSPV